MKWAIWIATVEASRFSLIMWLDKYLYFFSAIEIQVFYGMLALSSLAGRVHSQVCWRGHTLNAASLRSQGILHWSWFGAEGGVEGTVLEAVNLVRGTREVALSWEALTLVEISSWNQEQDASSRGSISGVTRGWWREMWHRFHLSEHRTYHPSCSKDSRSCQPPQGLCWLKKPTLPES